MRKLPPGIRIMASRLGNAVPVFLSPSRCALMLSANRASSPRVRPRYEIERRSRRDELFLLFAFLELPNDSVRVLHHPPAHVALVHGLAFFRVLHEMGDAGKAERQFRVVEVLLALEVDLEVLPFDCVQLFVEPDHARVAVRSLLLAEKERTLVDAVDDAVARRLAAGEPQQRGEHVRYVNHLVALGPRLDAARPTHQQRRANAALRRTEIRAIEKAAGSPPHQVIFGAVIAAVNNDSVVGNPQLVELVEQHTEVVVEHQQAIAPLAVVAFAREFVARGHGEVHQRVIEIEEKRLARGYAALHEIETPLLIFEVAGLFHFHGELLRQDRLYALALAALVHVRIAVALRNVMGVFEPHAFVVGAQRSVPLVKAVIRRPAPVLRPDVPLPQTARHVSGRGQNFGDGLLPPHDTAGVAAQYNRMVAGADRIPPGHQGRTGWRALRFDDVVCQLDTLGGELVRALGVSSPEDAAAVATQLAHAEVIDMEEEDVWFFRRH